MPASDEKWKVFLNEDPRILVAGSHLAGDWGDGVYGEPGERLHADPSLILTLLG